MDSFLNPPAAAKPAIWWFWGETTTTEHGITQDLEALKRVGFGGVVIYEQVFTARPDALKSLSSEWLARVRFAASECARLSLTLEINAGSGYVAGGPWITPRLGMQRLVSSALEIEGGRMFSGTLPQPPTKLDFYADVAVLAYPSPPGTEHVVPARTSEPAGLDLEVLFDPTSTKMVRIAPASEGRPVLIQLDYGRPFTARSLSYSLRANSKALVIATQMPGNWSDEFYGQNMRLDPPIGVLEASEDNAHWERVSELPARGYLHDSWDRQTIAFPAKTARFFRLNLHGWGRNERAKDDDLLLGGVELRGEARIDQWEKKSGNVVDFSNPDRTPNYAGDEVIDPASIVDLTARLGADGRLEWNPSPGRWTILRFGHTPTGARTKHGRPETMGLECDKLSAAAAAVQFTNYVGRILKEVRTAPGARLAGVNIDSAEHGSQNWTGDFPAQFLQRRGYELRRFLPAMAGRVVGSREESDRFLYDVRRTIADLMSDAYFGTFQRLCHAEGMTLMAQAPGLATCLPSDNIQAKGRTDIPMGEFWASQADGTIDCKEAASAAHVYDLPVAAAEAFTGSGADAHPAKLKPLADAALALGINRYVVLADVHQPWDDRKPGVTEDRFYLPYQRHNTWWEFSGGFWTTLARSAQMMRQGQPVNDLLYHLGDDTPLKIATSRLRPAPPEGYDYDVCGDEVLLRASVKDGRIVLPGGMTYRVLVLAGGEDMTLAAARKVEALVYDGAVVLGHVKPRGSRSLADGAQGNDKVRRIAEALWGDASGAKHAVRNRTPAELLAELGVPKDFEVASADTADIRWAHRRAGSDDIYFVANHQAEPAAFTGIFRATRRAPQAWNPETGEVNALPAFAEENGRTEVSLQVESHGSLFIVFRDGPIPKTATASLVGEVPVFQTLGDAWEVTFEPKRGAPERVNFPKLISWHEHSDPGAQHFSGTATYVQEFELPAVPRGKGLLDLGRVEVAASVTLNGRELGTVWKEPYTLDATAALRTGKNRLEVKVANLWTNRLIADAGLPESERISWCTFNPYKPGDSLVPSGLLGPVVLRARAK